MSEIGADVLAITGKHAARGARTRRWFFLAMGLVFLLPVLIGFGPTFFLRPLFGTTDYLGGPAPVQVPYDESTQLTLYPGGPFPVHLLLHGLALAAWFGLFAAQAWLVAAHRVALHRRLGIAGVAVAVAVIVTSVVTMIRAADRFAAIGLPAQAQVGVFVGDTLALAAFAALVAGGVYFRRNAAAHKRLMFLAGLSVIGPALSSTRPAGRLIDALLPDALTGIGLGGFLLLILCLLALVARDAIVDRRIQPATCGAILTFFAAIGIAAAAVYAAGGSAAYIAFLRSL